MPKLHVLALLFLCLPTLGLAQKNFVPGGLILHNGDTLSGKIDYRDWDLSPAEIHFQADAASAPQNYTPHTIAGFFLIEPHLVYQSAAVYLNQDPSKLSDMPAYSSIGEATRAYRPKRDTVFLEVLARGRLQLFECSDARQVHFLAQPSGDSIRELVNRKIMVNDALSDQPVYRKPMQVTLPLYRNQLKLLTLDCQERKPDFNKVPYFKESLIRIVDAYNKCQKSDEYRQLKPRSGRNIYLLGGIGLPTFSIKGPYTFENRITSSGSIAPVLGLGAEFDLGRSRGRRALGLEIYGSRFSVDRQADKPVEYITVHADLSYLRAFTYFRYYLPVNRVHPYFKLGVGGSYYNKHILNYTKDTGLGSPLAFSRELKSFDICFVGAVGARINRFALEARFENGTNLAEFDASELARMTMIFLVISYQFLR